MEAVFDPLGGILLGTTDVCAIMGITESYFCKLPNAERLELQRIALERHTVERLRVYTGAQALTDDEVIEALRMSMRTFARLPVAMRMHTRCKAFEAIERKAELLAHGLIAKERLRNAGRYGGRKAITTAAPETSP